MDDTRTRIRDAAIARFAAHGVGATTLRSIADAAGVSAQLIVHHFGSKAALAVACDEHVTATIREHKSAVMAAGGDADPVQALRDSEAEGPLLAYLARRLADDSPEVAKLVDDFVADSIVYMQQGIESGFLLPRDDLREQAIVLMLWNLGALVLRHHAKRLLGVDLAGPTEDQLVWIVPAAELLTGSLINPEAVRLHDLVAAGNAPDVADTGTLS